MLLGRDRRHNVDRLPPHAVLRLAQPVSPDDSPIIIIIMIYNYCYYS